MTTKTLQRISNKNETDTINYENVKLSREKICGICLENIVEKVGDNRFGILSGCRHCFCWTCIKTWRRVRNVYPATTKCCPECRVTSSLVCPSMIWIDLQSDKNKLFAKYKTAIKSDCKISKCFRSCLLEDECQYYNIKSNLESNVSIVAFYIILLFLTIVA